jgi:PPOX class probable F420-dependent enzyme
VIDYAQQKYVLFTTFRRDGRAVATPVWSVPIDGASFAFYTSSATGKAKRLAHTARVTVQPCDMRGRPAPGTDPVAASARLVSGEELAAIRARADEKYGFATTLVRWVDLVRHGLRGRRVPYGDLGVVVTVAES